MRENGEKDKSILATSHEGGCDVTLADMLQDAADRSNPKKTGKPLCKNTINKFRKQWNIGKATAHARTEAGPLPLQM